MPLVAAVVLWTVISIATVIIPVIKMSYYAKRMDIYKEVVFGDYAKVGIIISIVCIILTIAFVDY